MAGRAKIFRSGTKALPPCPRDPRADTGALAVEPGEQLADPPLEARARALSAELRCLVCQNQSIDDSNAPLAKDLRVLVREQIAAGKSDAEVMGFVVARYGEFVLLRPRFSWATALLWLAPLLLLGATAAPIVTRMRAAQPARGAAIISCRAEEARRVAASKGLSLTPVCAS